MKKALLGLVAALTLVGATMSSAEAGYYYKHGFYKPYYSYYVKPWYGYRYYKPRYYYGY